MAIAMTVTSLIGTFIIGFSMLPQTIVTFKTRRTDNISLALYFVMGVATSLITLYGIGLCAVPLNVKEIAFNYAANMPDVMSQAYAASLPDYNGVVTGYTVPGAAVIFGELFCAVTSFMIAFVKMSNMKKAKALGITEAEYIEQYNANKGVK